MHIPFKRILTHLFLGQPYKLHLFTKFPHIFRPLDINFEIRYYICAYILNVTFHKKTSRPQKASQVKNTPLQTLTYNVLGPAQNIRCIAAVWK